LSSRYPLKKWFSWLDGNIWISNVEEVLNVTVSRAKHTLRQLLISIHSQIRQRIIVFWFLIPRWPLRLMQNFDCFVPKGEMQWQKGKCGGGRGGLANR
jgi:hypothetical protein